MLIVFLRSLILYLLVIFALRVMGKRQIGELQPSELVVAIMISELASIPMEDISIPLLYGIIPVLTLIIAEIILSFITLKNRKIRRFISGKPSVLIENGTINEQEMEKLRFNIDDLIEELRISNQTNIEDIQYAILETSGQLSIIPRPEKNPPSAEDLNIDKKEEMYPLVIIIDGEIDYANLSRSNHSEKWLNIQLEKERIRKVKDIFVAYLDKDGNFIYQLKVKAKEQNK